MRGDHRKDPIQQCSRDGPLTGMERLVTQLPPVNP